jgi:thiol-disulfide isomerase/thioredoxin
MLKKTLGIWLMLVATVALVSACNSATPTTVEDQPATEEVMMDKNEATNEMMADDKATEEMMAEDKADDEMMADDKADDEMTADDKADDEMTADDKADDEMTADDKADDEMTADDKADDEMAADDKTDDEMTADDKADDEMTADEAVVIPDWFNVELTDVNTGETFRIADFKGKVVLLETMAVWCPTCVRQAQEIQKVHEMLGERDDFVSVTLDVDPNESEDMLKAYADQNGFDWNYAVSPHEVTRALGNLYSAQYLNPPVSPLLIIDQQGRVYGLPFGTIKKATNLKPTLETYFNGE